MHLSSLGSFWPALEGFAARSSLSGRDAVRTGPTAGEAGSPVTAAVREAAVNVTNKYCTRLQHMSNFFTP